MSLIDTGKVIINGRVIRNLADGNSILLEHAGDIINTFTGANGTSVHVRNRNGEQPTLTLRITKGSDDDVYFNNIMAQLQSNFASFIMLNGEYIQRVGDGTGNTRKITSLLEGGVPSVKPNSSSSSEGSADDTVVIYVFRFSSSKRIIG